MKKILLAAAALSLSTPALAANAAALFASKCAVCHGKDGKGTPAGKKLGAHDLTAHKHTEAEVKQIVTNGKGKMTPFKDKLSAEEIQALAKYVAGGLK